MTNKLSEIREAINTFDIDHARTLLRDALKNNATSETYYLASLIALNESQRKSFLQKAIELDPFHQEATEELTKLQSVNRQARASEHSADATQSGLDSASVTNDERQNESTSQFIVGIVGISTPLKKIPHIKGIQVTELPQDAQIIVLARDEKMDWLNVLYLGSAGRELIGWLSADNMKELRLGSEVVRAIDLPITEYEWNTRDDIQALIQCKIKDKIYIGRMVALPMVIGVGVIGIFIGLEIGYNLLFWPGLLAVFFAVIKAVEVFPKAMKHNTPLQTEIIRLHKVHKSAFQEAMEQQIKLLAIKTGFRVAGDAITRSVPNRKTITHRNR